MKNIYMLLLFALSFSSCASIVSSGKQDVYFTTQPPGAKVVIMKEGRSTIFDQGTTPFTATISRGDGFFSKADYVISIEKPGYESIEYSLSADLNGGWYIAGNFIFGGFLGWLIIDPASGAMWKFEKEYYSELISVKSATIDNGTTLLNIVMSDDIDNKILDSATRIYPNMN